MFEMRARRRLRSLPLLALFTMDHMSYEIDRNPALEPSLREMAEKSTARSRRP